MGSTVRRLSGIERLNLLHGITRPEEVMAFSYDWLLAEDSLTTKDFIAPSGYNWKPEHDDSRAVYNDRYQFGEYYGKVLYLRDIAPQMKDNLLSLLSDLDFDNAISIHVDAVEQREAGSFFARMMPWRSVGSPQTATGSWRRSGWLKSSQEA